MLMRDKLGKTIYELLCTRCDGDGFVDVSSTGLAAELNKPRRTVQGALHRQKEQGRIECIEQNVGPRKHRGGGGVDRYVVVEKAIEFEP